MNKQEIKKIITNEFGFSVNKIVLLEVNKNSFGTYDYIMFSVCGLEYQMVFDYTQGCYKLIIFNDNGRLY